MILIYLIILAVALFVQYIVAKKFEAIAFQKGYDETIHSCAMCFWLGIVGYLYVIALPVLNEQMKENGCSVNSESPTINNNEVISKAKENNHLDYNRYECQKIVVTNKNGSGHCFMCRESQDILKICKVENSIGTREIAICDNCIKLFNDNCSK